MEELGKKAGYLRGLLENTDFGGQEGLKKLFGAMTELICLSADRVTAIEDMMADLNDYVESIDDDLSELEHENDELPFGSDEDFGEFFDDDADEEEIQRRLHVLPGKTLPFKKPEAPASERELAGRLCPECGKFFFVDAGDSPASRYICPHCGKKVRAQALTPENAPIAAPVR